MRYIGELNKSAEGDDRPEASKLNNCKVEFNIKEGSKDWLIGKNIKSLFK